MTACSFETWLMFNKTVTCSLKNSQLRKGEELRRQKISIKHLKWIRPWKVSVAVFHKGEWPIVFWTSLTHYYLSYTSLNPILTLNPNLHPKNRWNVARLSGQVKYFLMWPWQLSVLHSATYRKTTNMQMRKILRASTKLVETQEQNLHVHRFFSYIWCIFACYEMSREKAQFKFVCSF